MSDCRESQLSSCSCWCASGNLCPAHVGFKIILKERENKGESGLWFSMRELRKENRSWSKIWRKRHCSVFSSEKRATGSFCRKGSAGSQCQSWALLWGNSSFTSGGLVNNNQRVVPCTLGNHKEKGLDCSLSVPQVPSLYDSALLLNL